MEIKIGSKNTNDIVLDHPSVGRDHARITIKEDKFYVLEDLNSKNGIWVNGRRIRKKRIGIEDEIWIGKFKIDPEDFFKKVQALHFKEKKDFTEEYKSLFKEIKKYQDQKDKIMKTPLLPMLLRIGLGVVVILVLIFFPKAIPDSSVRYGLIMLVGIVSTSATFWISRKDKNRDKLDRLKLSYEDKLVCPKCHASLLNYNLTYLKGRGKCINTRCDAVYNKNEIN